MKNTLSIICFLLAGFCSYAQVPGKFRKNKTTLPLSWSMTQEDQKKFETQNLSNPETKRKGYQDPGKESLVKGRMRLRVMSSVELNPLLQYDQGLNESAGLSEDYIGLINVKNQTTSMIGGGVDYTPIRFRKFEMNMSYDFLIGANFNRYRHEKNVGRLSVSKEFGTNSRIAFEYTANRYRRFAQNEDELKLGEDLGRIRSLKMSIGKEKDLWWDFGVSLNAADFDTSRFDTPQSPWFLGLHLEGGSYDGKIEIDVFPQKPINFRGFSDLNAINAPNVYLKEAVLAGEIRLIFFLNFMRGAPKKTEKLKEKKWNLKNKMHFGFEVPTGLSFMGRIPRINLDPASLPENEMVTPKWYYGIGLNMDHSLYRNLKLQVGARVIVNQGAQVNIANQEQGRMTRSEVDFWSSEIPVNLFYEKPINMTSKVIIGAGIIKQFLFDAGLRRRVTDFVELESLTAAPEDFGTLNATAGNLFVGYKVAINNNCILQSTLGLDRTLDPMMIQGQSYRLTRVSLTNTILF